MIWGNLQLGLIVIKRLATGEGLTVQCSAVGMLEAVHPGEPINKQLMGYTGNWVASFKQLTFTLYLLRSCCLDLFLPPSLLPPRPLSHAELIRENKRAELISAGLPGESGAKSAINSIFIHPTPLVLLGELSQRSLSGWESKGIKTCTHTQC